MGWTTPRTFVTAEVETAAIFNAHLRDNLLALNGFVRKTADESVTSSAVLQNDDQLLYAIPAAGTYVIDLWLQVTSAANAAGDIGIAFTYPTGTITTFVFGADTTLASAHASSSVEVRSDAFTSGTLFATFGASTAGTSIYVHAVLVATASGTLQLQWAQQASNVNATTVKAGSHMSVTQKV